LLFKKFSDKGMRVEERLLKKVSKKQLKGVVILWDMFQ